MSDLITRLEHHSKDHGNGMLLHAAIFGEAAAALTTAQSEADALRAEVERLEAENARLRETLGTICKDSNPDWTEKRAYPECVLDDIHEMAVKAYYELKS